MEEREIARFECAGDVRVMRVGADGEKIVVREDLSGPSVLLAYGEKNRTLRVSLAAEDAARLLRLGFCGGVDSLWSYLSDEAHDIVDLMDLCDGLGVPYAFSSEGPGGVLQFRPARRSDRGPGAPPAIRLG